ncbi:MAG: AI-2E family transporter [bacterium]|nr:AI-2E family transporter [bacterium]
MKTIEISHRTIIFSTLFIGSLWVLFQIREIISGLFIAILLMTALNPIVDKLVKFRVPRPLAILIAYIILITSVVLGLASIIPPLVRETTDLVNRLPSLFDQLGLWLESIGINGVNGGTIAGQLIQLGAIPGNLIRLVVSILSNLLSVFTVLLITFYLLLERKNLDKYLLVLFGQGAEPKAKSFVDKLEARLGSWVRGEVILMLIIGIATYIGLLLLGVPNALPLSILAGLFELLPNVGPTLAAVPAVLLAFSISPLMGLSTLALYFLVQQLENGIIVPKVMQTVVGVNPLITLLVLAIGFKLGGVFGAVLSVPILIVGQVVATEVFSIKQLKG